jgi:hypothetical protein
MFFFSMNGTHHNGIRGTAEPGRLEAELLAPREQHAQRWIQRDRQNSGDDHGKSLGISEWPEKAAFLGFQCQHRQK